MAVRKKKAKKASVAGRFPNGLDKAIKAADISKAELARRLDMDRPYLLRVVEGYYNPSVVMAIAIARELDTTVEALWGKLKFEENRRR